MVRNDGPAPRARRPAFFLAAAALVLVFSSPARADEATLRKGLDYYASIAPKNPEGKIGGWPMTFGPGLKYGTGENGKPMPLDCVCIQDPATAAAALTFLRAGKQLNEPKYVEIARQVGDNLIAGMGTTGGWDYEMWLAPGGARSLHIMGLAATQGNPPASNQAVYDDNVTYNPGEFLYCLWWVTKDQKHLDGWKRVMDGIVKNQRPAGGYPQKGGGGGFHAAATFNDGVMLNAANVLVRAYRRTGDRKYLESVLKCGGFLIRAQGDGGGYGAQIDDGGKILAARKFEPPALGPDATTDAIRILAMCYDWSGDPQYLAPMGKAVDWLKKVQLKPGTWARYYHPGGGPWYRAESGKDVSSPGQAKPGYVWTGEWGAAGIEIGSAYAGKGKKDPPAIPAGGTPGLGVVLKSVARSGKFEMTAQEAAASQGADGSWSGTKAAAKGGRKKGGGGGGGPLLTGQFVAACNALLDALGPAPQGPTADAGGGTGTGNESLPPAEPSPSDEP